MKIETKFDIGQEVYFIKKQNVGEICNYCWQEIPNKIHFAWRYSMHKITIDRILINDSIKDIIQYRGFPVQDFFDEDNLFLTRDEAKAECDRRNEEMK